MRNPRGKCRGDNKLSCWPLASRGRRSMAKAKEIELIEETPIRIVLPLGPAFDAPLVLPDSLADIRADRLEGETNYSAALRGYREIPRLYRPRIQQGNFAALEEMLRYAPDLMALRWVRDACAQAERQGRRHARPGRPHGRTEETRRLVRVVGPLVDAIRLQRGLSIEQAIRELAYYEAEDANGERYPSSRGLSERRLHDLYYKERKLDGTMIPYAVRYPEHARIVPARELHSEPVCARPGQVIGCRLHGAMINAPDAIDPA